MKVCSKCKFDKELHDFNKKKSSPDGHQTICRECSNAKSAIHYQNNKLAYRNSKKKSIQTLKDYVIKYLLEHPCIDCGELNPVCLDFDHVSGDKTRNISDMIHAGVSIETLKTEMEKCVIRCANCHRKKTAKDFDWFRNKS